MKKYVLLFVMCALLLVGCGNSEVTKGYDNMQIGKKIDSYQLDLRIYGVYNNKSINDIVRIDNYKNEQYRINYADIDKNPSQNNDNSLDKALYIINGKKYRQTTDKTYAEVTEEALYTNTNLYLEGINNLKEGKYLRDEVVGNNTYKVYSIKVSSSTMKNILSNSVLSDINLVKDVTGEAWMDKDGYIYKIIYNVNEGLADSSKNLIVNASYFRINNISEIKKMINID